VASALSKADVSSRALVRARQGTVILSGKVVSLAQKQRAENVAHGVAGVVEVDNQLEVEPSAAPTDEQLRAAIQKRLEADSYLAGMPIEIAVGDGIVSLGGTLDTLYAKRRALELAGIDGVRVLDGEALLVSPRRPKPLAPLAASEDPQSRVVPDGLDSRARSVPRNDETLQRQVAYRLNHHPSLAARRVRVSVDRGVAIISGSVDSDFQSSCAEHAAGGVPGVHRVDNRLRLEPSNPLVRDDAVIKRQLEEELWWDARLDPDKLQVVVLNGGATISGEVATFEERDAIIENILQVAPTTFTNQVQVQEQPQLAHASDDGI
jgi:osmotically-inducible protein OsmY